MALLSINELLPRTVLREVFTHVPARQLVLSCRPVCSLWRDLIDTATLWKLKSLRDGFITEDWDQPVADWKSFYFLCILRRNLLRNPCGEEGMATWHIDDNGGDRWNVESLPVARGTDFPSPQVRNYFVTSYRLCRKSQVVNLKAEGYWEELMDEYRPDIVVTDWFASRGDCGCTYSIRVQLLSADNIALASFEPPPVTIPQWNDATWTEVTHTFSDYPRGVRHILFQHGGKDTQSWAGWYGPRVTNSSIVISPKVTRNREPSTGPHRPRAASDGQEQMTSSGDGPVGAPEWPLVCRLPPMRKPRRRCPRTSRTSRPAAAAALPTRLQPPARPHRYGDPQETRACVTASSPRTATSRWQTGGASFFFLLFFFFCFSFFFLFFK
ncbi:F-box only protein 6-like [Phyllostomus hastatus]|uniref:F-box only protein 6-like n=1 Tax=Phyllostomus hastatus TaxID=9423 RepID=UPI001E680693|nr:F-box only protein 6-like [Phyllostomus hastatus]XP_045714869.1 F-box only protein 6-like [Phyllostomus hastatus]